MQHLYVSGTLLLCCRRKVSNFSHEAAQQKSKRLQSAVSHNAPKGYLTRNFTKCYTNELQRRDLVVTPNLEILQKGIWYLPIRVGNFAIPAQCKTERGNDSPARPCQCRTPEENCSRMRRSAAGVAKHHHWRAIGRLPCLLFLARNATIEWHTSN